jgi:hypothetical protein
MRAAGRSRYSLDVEPDLRNLSQCIRNARWAFATPRADDEGQAKERAPEVRVSRRLLPRPYRRGFGDPILAQRAAWDGRERSYYADAIRAIVQRADPDLRDVTAAFQEAVADVFDGYLSEANRAGAWKPDRPVLAPLVAWGPAGPDEDGPYALPSSPSEGVRAGIVVLPISHTDRALVGWTLLAHETAGHDILGSRKGLIPEIAGNLRRRRALKDSGLGRYFASYLEEAVCDVIGVLNMGPAAAAGLIAYFKGWNAGLGYPSALGRTQDDKHHPIEVLRALLVAQTIPLLEFRGAGAWHREILARARKELGTRRLTVNGKRLAPERLLRETRIVARTIATIPLEKLGGLALVEIQNWLDDDEAVVDDLRRQIRSGRIRSRFGDEYYATHAVAAGVLESLAGGAPLGTIFARTVTALRRMARANRVWGGD